MSDLIKYKGQVCKRVDADDKILKISQLLNDVISYAKKDLQMGKTYSRKLQLQGGELEISLTITRFAPVGGTRNTRIVKGGGHQVSIKVVFNSKVVLSSSDSLSILAQAGTQNKLVKDITKALN